MGRMLVGNHSMAKPILENRSSSPIHANSETRKIFPPSGFCHRPTEKRADKANGLNFQPFASEP
jgi:hypothetical protein